MNEAERLQILEMIEKGVITASEGVRLLNSLEGELDETEIPLVAETNATSTGQPETAPEPEVLEQEPASKTKTSSPSNEFDSQDQEVAQLVVDPPVGGYWYHRDQWIVHVPRIPGERFWFLVCLPVVSVFIWHHRHQPISCQPYRTLDACQNPSRAGGVASDNRHQHASPHPFCCLDHAHI